MHMKTNTIIHKAKRSFFTAGVDISLWHKATSSGTRPNTKSLKAFRLLAGADLLPRTRSALRLFTELQEWCDVISISYSVGQNQHPAPMDLANESCRGKTVLHLPQGIYLPVSTKALLSRVKDEMKTKDKSLFIQRGENFLFFLSFFILFFSFFFLSMVIFIRFSQLS